MKSKLVILFLFIVSGLFAQTTDNFDSYEATVLAGQGSWLSSQGTIGVYVSSGDGEVYPAASATESASYYNGTFSDDQYAQLTITAISSQYIGVAVRASADNYYAYYSNSATCYLMKIVEGVATELDASGTPFQVNDVVKLVAYGDTLFCYINGVLDTNIDTDGKITDTDLSSGCPGVGGYGSSNTTRGDSWEGGDYSEGEPPEEPVEGQPIAAWMMNSLNDTMDIDDNGTYDLNDRDPDSQFSAVYGYKEPPYAQVIDYDDGGNVTAGPISLGEEFSVSLWFYTVGTAEFPTFISNKQSDADNGFEIYGRSNNQVVFNTHNASDDNVIQTLGSAYSNKTWTHLVATVDRTNGYARLWINGADAMSGISDTLIHTDFDNNDSIAIGSQRLGNYPVEGAIDNVQIYDYRLSSAQIDSLYNLGSTNFVLYDGTEELPAEYTGAKMAYLINGLNHKIYLRSGYNYLAGWWYGITPIQTPSTLSGYGYDSTFVLSVTQKYAIPENVNDGDYVGYWQECPTWMSGNAITYNIKENWNNAFAINQYTGLITIADSSKIDGKIVTADTVINLIIRTTDEMLGYELDTAKIWVKEASKCVFIDYAYGDGGNGSRETPWNSIDDITFAIEKGYFFKRGSTVLQGIVTFEDLVSSAAHPMVLAAYGTGNKPLWDANNIPYQQFYIGDEDGLLPSAHIYFYDLSFRELKWRVVFSHSPSCYIGFYNIDTDDIGTTSDCNPLFTFNDDTYADSAEYRPFEMININVLGDNCMCATVKAGAGPTHIYNLYQDGGTGGIRFPGGHGHILAHSYIEDGRLSEGTDGSSSAVQIRANNTLIEDCRFELVNGRNIVDISYPSDNLKQWWMPDTILINNIYASGWDGVRSAVRIGISSEVVENCDSIVIFNSVFKNGANAYGGVYLPQGKNIYIERNIFGDVGDYGIWVGDVNGNGLDNVNIKYNSIYGSNVGSIYAEDASNVYIYNNTSSMNSTDGYEIVNSDYVTIRNNLEPSISISSVTNYVQSDNYTVTSPYTYFEDYDNGDYHLTSDAENAIDEGYDLGETYDIEGNTVPAGEGTDIGAYEYIP
jgi:hypothetical protein